MLLTITVARAADRFASSAAGSDGCASKVVVADVASGKVVSSRLPSVGDDDGRGSSTATAFHVFPVAALTGWVVTVVDHRPSFATAERFPDAEALAVTPCRTITCAPDRASSDT